MCHYPRKLNALLLSPEVEHSFVELKPKEQRALEGARELAKPQISPLRYAPVEMTNLLGD